MALAGAVTDSIWVWRTDLSIRTARLALALACSRARKNKPNQEQLKASWLAVVEGWQHCRQLINRIARWATYRRGVFGWEIKEFRTESGRWISIRLRRRHLPSFCSALVAGRRTRYRKWRRAGRDFQGKKPQNKQTKKLFQGCFYHKIKLTWAIVDMSRPNFSK